MSTPISECQHLISLGIDFWRSTFGESTLGIDCWGIDSLNRLFFLMEEISCHTSENKNTCILHIEHGMEREWGRWAGRHQVDSQNSALQWFFLWKLWRTAAQLAECCKIYMACYLRVSYCCQNGAIYHNLTPSTANGHVINSKPLKGRITVGLSKAVTRNGMLYLAISWLAMSREFSKAGPIINELARIFYTQQTKDWTHSRH